MVSSSSYKMQLFYSTIAVIILTLASINAEKSSSPINPQSIPLPIGHLKPLGGHRPPDVQIDELHEVPSPDEFWEKYVKHERAVILRGAAKQSPGFELWTDEYLKEQYGDLEVRLEGKKEKGKSHLPQGDKGLGRSTMRHFIDHYHTTNRYMVSELPAPMYPEVSVPPCLSCGLLRDRLVEIDIWMSGGNSQSIMHKDAFNSLNCLLNGTKHWKLIERKYEKWLHKAWEPEREVGGYSEINVNEVDMMKHPNISKVPWSNFTIYAGDCLFLPTRYYHQVTSLGDTNLAVAFLFSFLLNDNDNYGCDETKLEHLPLSDFDVAWQWPGDDGYMTMGHMDIWEMRESWLQTASEKGVLSMEDILKTESQDLPYRFPGKDPASYRELIEKAWKCVDPEGKGHLTEEDIRNLHPDALRQYVLIMEPADPSNTNIHELYYVQYETLKEFIEVLLFRDGFLTRPKFYMLYHEVLGGSDEHAKQIFDKLTGDPTKDKALPDDIAENMEYALEPYRLHEMVQHTKPDGDEMEQAFDLKDEL